MVLSQDHKARVSEPTGAAERLTIDSLKPMGDKAIREKPADIEKQFVILLFCFFKLECILFKTL